MVVSAQPRAIRVLVLACLAVCAAARAGLAHPVAFTFADARLERGRIDVRVTVHVLDVAHDLKISRPATLFERTVMSERRQALIDLVDRDFRIFADNQQLRGEWGEIKGFAEQDSLAIEISYPLDTAPGIVRIRSTLFSYDPEHRTLLSLYDGGALAEQGILDASRDEVAYFPSTGRGLTAVARWFVPAGMQCILVSADAIVFMIGLMLLGGTRRRLVRIVGAFIIAHSLTLTMTILDRVTPPSKLLGPAIALSIVYVAADNLLVRSGRDVRIWVAAALGSLYGFAFADALRGIGLPRSAVVPSLLSFNVGLELGVSLVALATGAVVLLAQGQNDRPARGILVAGSLAVMAAGAFWFVQRAFFPPSPI